MPRDAAPPAPDGILDDHAAPDRGFRRHANPVSLLLLGGLLAAALAGLFGGGKASIARVEAPAATLSVATPQVLRNGTFFETRIEAVARADIADAVIAIPPALWRDLTINSSVPAPGDEEYADGAYRFHYGRIAAGATLAVKFDGQINPPLVLGNRGTVTLLDGDRPLARVPVTIKVLP